MSIGFYVTPSFVTNFVNISAVSLSNSQSFRRSMSFKQHEFEAEAAVASEIVKKVNNILELRNSSSREDYRAYKERKMSRRKSFHISR